MNIKKKSGSYDAYVMDLSYVELKCIEQALATAQEQSSDPEPDAVRDAILQGLRWYSERLPLPGEDEETVEKKAEKGEVDGLSDEDLSLPSPDEELPSEDMAGGIEEPGAPIEQDEESPFPTEPEYSGSPAHESLDELPDPSLDELPDPSLDEKLKPLKTSRRSPVGMKKTGWGDEVRVSYKGKGNEDSAYYGDKRDREDVRNTAARMIKHKRAQDRKPPIKEKLEEASMDRLGTHKTAAIDNDKVLSVILYNTEVVHVDKATGKVTLNTGGWDTATTFARMNQAAAQFGLPYKAFRKNGSCFVTVNGKVLPFRENTVTFPARPEEAPVEDETVGLPDPEEDLQGYRDKLAKIRGQGRYLGVDSSDPTLQGRLDRELKRNAKRPR